MAELRSEAAAAAGQADVTAAAESRAAAAEAELADARAHAATAEAELQGMEEAISTLQAKVLRFLVLDPEHTATEHTAIGFKPIAGGHDI